MKKVLKKYNLFYFAAVCYYLAVIIHFIGTKEFDTLSFSLASVMLCLGYDKAKRNKVKKS